MENRVKNVRFSIQNKIIGYFVILSLVTILIFEGISYLSLHRFSYSTVSGVLESQLRYSTYMYSSYLSDYRLEDAILQDKNQFYRNNDGQVQIMNNSGVVLYDSSGSAQVGNQIETSDVESAMKGEQGSFTGTNSFLEGKIMALSRPLNSRGEQVGILRVTTSLEEVDKMIFYRFLIFLGIGILFFIITLFISYLMAKSIVKPINNLTLVAQKLANGQLDVRAQENNYNEIGVLGKTLNMMTNNIKEKDQIKSDFISSVSHELRTPLTSINGWASTLLYDPGDKELVSQGLTIIEGECVRLSDMVEDLLDFSRFTSGRVDLKKEEVNLTEIAIGIKQQLTPRSKSLGINLILDYQEEDMMGIVDQNRIKQVLINLIDNALKFTAEDGTVMLNLYEEGAMAVFEVIDTGIGIAQEEIDRVTERFYRGSNSNSHTGLGLSITEEIVKAHKGEMIITSKLNQGTTIKVKLPRGSK